MMKSFTITLLRGFCPKAYCLWATTLLSKFLRHFKNFFLVYFCVWGTLLASATCRAPPIIHYLSKGFLWCIIDNLIMYHISKVHEPACCYLIVSMFHLVWRGMKTKFFHYHYFILLYDYFWILWISNLNAYFRLARRPAFSIMKGDLWHNLSMMRVRVAGLPHVWHSNEDHQAVAPH